MLPTEKVFLDANVLLEVMLERAKADDVSNVLQTSHYEFYVSTLTVHILYYFAEKAALPVDYREGFASLARWIPLDEKQLRLAQRRYDGRDFEDCLQASGAELADCTRVFTLDKRFAEHSGTKLPVTVL